MPEILPQEAEQATGEAAPKDLRAELQDDLEGRFAASLSASGTLPTAASEALVALLGSPNPIAADVIAALGLEDPAQPEITHE